MDIPRKTAVEKKGIVEDMTLAVFSTTREILRRKQEEKIFSGRLLSGLITLTILLLRIEKRKLKNQNS